MVAQFLIKRRRAPRICPWANSLPDLCKWSTPLTYLYLCWHICRWYHTWYIKPLYRYIGRNLNNWYTNLSWCNSTNMSLNVSETKLMYISSRHKPHTVANCDHDICICDSKIQVSYVEKLLGVTISNTLCWDAHIDHLIKKCNSYLFLFYNSYIWYHLDFCCIIWGNCSSTLEDKLVKFQ